MKNLPCIIFLSAIASLLLLAVASALGVSIAYWSVAAHIGAFSGAAGVLAIFLTDYAPRRGYNAGPALPNAEAATALGVTRTVRSRLAPANERPLDVTVIEGAMATLGLRNDPATVSII